MVLSSYLLRYPYTLVWRIVKKLRKNPRTAIYCGDILDYVVLEPVLRHLPRARLEIVAKNPRVRRDLHALGICARCWPTFPDAVIMARHALHKFPAPGIIKIGFRHGAYHFKNFISPQKYNAFDLYFFTSRSELRQAAAIGINRGCAIGFPKIDPAFDGSIPRHALSGLARRLQLDPRRKTIMFSATWDRSGMSAIERWASALDVFTRQYNVLVTVHPFTSRKYRRLLLANADIRFIRDPRIMPYLMLADVLISDTSSIIAEFCALDKPIITFRVGRSRRLSAEIERLLEAISMRIAAAGELPSAIESALRNPGAQSHSRRQSCRRLFDALDGKAGARAAAIIRAFIQCDERDHTDPRGACSPPLRLASPAVSLKHPRAIRPSAVPDIG